ncbi:MAG: hypothetical protein ACKOUT_13105 [Novosphingobium sp.]
MRKFLYPAASALALLCAAGPLAVYAQTDATSTVAVTTPVLTAAQQTDFDSWTAEQRTAYGTWPADYQTYYWTLSPAQMTGWWRLTAEQRSQIMAMTPEQRTSTWASVEAQLSGQPAAGVVQANPVGSSEMPTATPPAPVAAADPVPPATPADPAYQAGPYKGALTAPPAEAMNKTYPVCTRKLQDSCRNPGGK